MQIDARRPVAALAGRLPLLAFVLAAGVILGITLGRAADDEPESGGSTAVALDVGVNPHVPSPATHAPRARPAPRGAQEWTQQREASRAQALRRRQAERQAYIDRYAHEQVDARWAGRTEATMLQASRSAQVLELGAEPHALEIDCRTSMCRVQADFASQSSAEDWFTLFSTNLGREMPKASFLYSRNDDGSARVLAYGLARSAQ